VLTVRRVSLTARWIAIQSIRAGLLARYCGQSRALLSRAVVRPKVLYLTTHDTVCARARSYFRSTTRKSGLWGQHQTEPALMDFRISSR